MAIIVHEASRSKRGCSSFRLKAGVLPFPIGDNKWATEFSEGDRQKIKDSGKSEILALTPEELAAWKTAMKSVYDQFTPSIGKDIVDAALATNGK